jgi:serine/threonine-protein kinase
MATVHFGRLVGDAGFSRIVAVKRLHADLALEPEIASSLLEEARIVSRIEHPNVVATLDVLLAEDQALLVMEYVRGESLARLLRAARTRSVAIPPAITAGIACGMLYGLHAAHEAASESGEPLGIVHRDVSPENVLVSASGVARILDFGIAKARGRLSTTRGGQIKGKIRYMAPEQILCREVSRRTDVYAAGIVIWEALTGRRLFEGSDEAAIVTAALEHTIQAPSGVAPSAPIALDAVVLRALERNAAGRYATARDFAVAIEEAIKIATPREIGEWVERAAGDVIASRDATVAGIERGTIDAQDPTKATDAGESTRIVNGGQPRSRDNRPVPRAAPLGGAYETAFLGSRASNPTLREGDAPESVPRSKPESEGVTWAPPTNDATGRRRLGWAAALVVLLVFGVAFAFRITRSPPSPPAATSEPAASASAIVPVGQARSATELPRESAQSAAPPTPTSTSSATAAPKSTSRVRAKSGNPPPAGSPPKACSPPYTIDAAGVRHLKPECL